MSQTGDFRNEEDPEVEEMKEEENPLPQSLSVSTAVKEDQKPIDGTNSKYRSLLQTVESGKDLKQLELKGLEEEEVFFKLVRDQREKVCFFSEKVII